VPTVLIIWENRMIDEQKEKRAYNKSKGISKEKPPKIKFEAHYGATKGDLEYLKAQLQAEAEVRMHTLFVEIAKIGVTLINVDTRILELRVEMRWLVKALGSLITLGFIALGTLIALGGK
jgi:hypothetical protein